MWDFLKCLVISFFPAFFMFALLCVVIAESTFTSEKEETYTFYGVLVFCIGMIVYMMYIAKTVNHMW